MFKIFRKNKNNGFSNKINFWQTVIIFIIFMIALLFFIIQVIIDLFDKTPTYNNNIEQYIQKKDTDEIDESKRITNYSNFYTIQGILEQFVNCLVCNQYDDAYKVLDKEFLYNFKNKKECLEYLKNYTKENFVVLEDYQYFVNTNKLKKLYLLNLNDYLAEYINKNGDLIKIGVRVEPKQRTYSIFFMEI